MTTIIIKRMILFGMIVTLLSFDLPKDWYADGGNPDQYDMGIDIGAGQDGGNAATIKSKFKKDNYEIGGTLMQQCKADKYLGKRVRMSGYMKTENVKGWAAFWFRADASDGEHLAFDNMVDRYIKGTTGWTKYDIVLDVPANASTLFYGGLLGGAGQIWFDNIRFEIVDNTVSTTGTFKFSEKEKGIILSEPSNLDFSE